MIIYGTALLAACHLPGIVPGDLLGKAIGVQTKVGGVGIAMLLLIFARRYMEKKNFLPQLTEIGVEYRGGDVWRAGRHRQWRLGRAGRDRSQAGAVWRAGATLHTGLCCLLGPSLLFFITRQ